jgi:hypothetical protein
MNNSLHIKMQETDIIHLLEKENSIAYVPGGCSYNTIRVFNVNV